MEKKISASQLKVLNLKKSILLPIQHYFKDLELSGLLLIIVTILALIIANSTLSDAYMRIWHTKMGVNFGTWSMSFDFHTLINDVLMTLFFVVVGGEIKREIIEGALSSKEKAILPVIAALGGMLFPALIYTAFNFGQTSASGWGIPTATDIAFSLTVFSLLGKKAPFSLKIFLAALAIADDLGAIVVIALFYSTNIDWYHLSAGIFIIAVLLGMNKIGVKNILYYSFFGILLWYFFFMAGIHPTISGVIFAIAVPFSFSNYNQIFETQLAIVQNCVATLADKNITDKLMRGEIIEKMQHESNKMEAPLHNVLAFLLPISNYYIMPLFAFANAGIIIDSEAFSSIFSPVALGIIFGLMLGKSTGILLTSYIAVKLKIAQIPDDVNWKHIYGMAWLAGIGFTMSMFVTGLAFKDLQYIESAKIAILLASTLSGTIGYILLKLMQKKSV